MEQVTLGKTGICVNKNGFGALPIQRISDEEAVLLLRKACDNGITFFDTARAYTDSEHKLGLAFHDRWDDTIYGFLQNSCGHTRRILEGFGDLPCAAAERLS